MSVTNDWFCGKSLSCQLSRWAGPAPAHRLLSGLEPERKKAKRQDAVVADPDDYNADLCIGFQPYN